MNNGQTLALCICHALPELTFNGLLPLVVGGVTGIDYGVHSVTFLYSSAFTENTYNTDSFMRL